MNVTQNATLQSILTLIQGLNVSNLTTGWLAFLPPKYSAVLVFLVATIQGGLGIYTHYFHPNGTQLPPTQ